MQSESGVITCMGKNFLLITDQKAVAYTFNPTNWQNKEHKTTNFEN